MQYAPTNAMQNNTMTKFNPDIHHRRSVRLKDYDYSQAGAYFVTACAWNRECLFGEIVDGTMRLNEYGRVVQACWDDIKNHYPHVELDTFVIMPNHVHGIITIVDDTRDVNANIGVVAGSVGAGLKPAPTKTDNKRHGLSEIIRAFKTFSSRRINKIHDNPGCPVWQRNYYEHVIRNDDELNGIRKYINDNLLKWELDEENPVNVKEGRPTGSPLQ